MRVSFMFTALLTATLKSFLVVLTLSALDWRCLVKRFSFSSFDNFPNSFFFFLNPDLYSAAHTMWHRDGHGGLPCFMTKTCMGTREGIAVCYLCVNEWTIVWWSCVYSYVWCSRGHSTIEREDLVPYFQTPCWVHQITVLVVAKVSFCCHSHCLKENPISK